MSLTDEECVGNLHMNGYRLTEAVANDGYSEIWRAEKGADQKLCCIVHFKANLPPTFRSVMFEDYIADTPYLSYNGNLGEVFRIYNGVDSIFVLGQYVEPPGRDLKSLQKAFVDRTIPEELSKPLFQGIAIGLRLLHRQGFAHRNLNLTNLAYNDSTGRGFVTGYSLRENSRQVDDCPNLYEHLRPVQDQSQPADHFKNDVWTLGAIILITTRGLSRLNQFREDNLKTPNDMTEIDDCYEGDQRGLMRKMLDYYPSQRISMANIADHPWFNPQQAEAAAPMAAVSKFQPSKKYFTVPYGVRVKMELEEAGIEIIDHISSGAYGKVFKVALTHQLLVDYPGHKFAAMKVAELSQSNHYMWAQTKNEVQLLQNVEHKNIIKMIKLFCYPNVLITLMELAKGSLGGEIKGLVMDHEVAARVEAHFKPYIKGACEGLQFLHRSGYAHRDLKPDNILITRNNEAVLCDFSFSRVIKEGELSTSFVGTPGYSPPEIIHKLRYQPMKADSWSMGITIYRCLTGDSLIPYRRGDQEDQINSLIAQRTMRVQYSVMSDEAKNLVYNLLCMLEKDRWSMNDALKCSFFPQESSADETQAGPIDDEGIGASRPVSPVAGPSHMVSGPKGQGSQAERLMMYHVVTGPDRHVSGIAGNLDAEFSKQTAAEQGHEFIDARHWVERKPDARVRADTGFATTVSGTRSARQRASSGSSVSIAEEAITLNDRSRSPSQEDRAPVHFYIGSSSSPSAKEADAGASVSKPSAHKSSPVGGTEKEPVRKRPESR